MKKEQIVAMQKTIMENEIIVTYNFCRNKRILTVFEFVMETQNDPLDDIINELRVNAYYVLALLLGKNVSEDPADFMPRYKKAWYFLRPFVVETIKEMRELYA